MFHVHGTHTWLSICSSGGGGLEAWGGARTPEGRGDLFRREKSFVHVHCAPFVTRHLGDTAQPHPFPSIAAHWTLGSRQPAMLKVLWEKSRTCILISSCLKLL